MEKIGRLIWCYLIFLHIFAKTGFSKKCGNSCCVNFYQISNGSCIECPLGTHGVNCTGKCVRGFYGKLCQSPCKCPAESCNVSYGCINGITECPLGTHGVNCTGKCVKGFYGKFCQSPCKCPAESCNASYGCLEEITEEGEDSISELWVNVIYALIGSVITVSMSFICLLFFLKSWFSKTNASSTVTNQLDTDQTVDQQEHGDESRSLSSNTTETVLQGIPNHSYTDLRFSTVHPPYDNSNDCESVSEQDALSTDSLPSHKVINGYKKENYDEAKCEGKYEQLFKDKVYNVLSLRIPRPPFRPNRQNRR